MLALLNYENIYDPYWVEGIMHVTPMQSELANTGYFLEGQQLMVYSVDDE